MRWTSVGEEKCPITGAEICELAGLRTEVAQFRNEQKSMGKQVAVLNRTIFGNGKVGMKEGYDKMTVKVGALLWLNGALVIALLGNLIAVLAGAYR
jgi:hypothetical protein